jgi:hypothetical protein
LEVTGDPSFNVNDNVVARITKNGVLVILNANREGDGAWTQPIDNPWVFS